MMTMPNTKEEHDAMLAQWSAVAIPCFHVLIEWMGITGDVWTYPVPSEGGELQALPKEPFRDIMVRHLGEVTTLRCFEDAMGGFQEEIMDRFLENGGGLTICDSWRLGHKLFHLVYDDANPV